MRRMSSLWTWYLVALLLLPALASREEAGTIRALLCRLPCMKSAGRNGNGKNEHENAVANDVLHDVALLERDG